MKSLLLFLLGLLPGLTAAQFAPDVHNSVKLSAEATDAALTLRWVTDPAVTGYTLFRRPYGDTAWTDTLARYGPATTTHRDSDVRPGQAYEYRVDKLTAPDLDSGVGYLLGGYRLPAVHAGGGLLIVVSSTTLPEIESELADYREVLLTDGWATELSVVPPAAGVRQVKDSILAAHRRRPFTHLLLLDDVRIAYSGNIAPDAHFEDHHGAWASDLYYGDLDGTWTDTLVSNVSAADSVNHNLPGDGKWDQDALPDGVDLAVGRVDFRRLPAIADDRFTLLRRYLRKNIDYRTGVTVPLRRAMVRNLNPWRGALGQSALRDFPTLVGPDSISYERWEDVFDRSYQFFFGAGNGGYPSAIRNGNSGWFNGRDFQSVFTSWFSSYVGDYGLENCYMKAALSSGSVLTAAFVGAPLAHTHPMGLGRTIGQAMRASQNNDGRYVTGLFARGVHLNLLGDPTLRAYVVAPPPTLSLSGSDGVVDLSWSPSPDPAVDGYYLYRRADGQPFVLIDSTDATAYRDLLPDPVVSYDYLLRAAKWEVTPSGSFRNLSAGVSARRTVSTAAGPAGELRLKLYPNPTQGILQVAADRPLLRLTITDLSGRIVRTVQPGGVRALRLPLGDLSPGLYLVRVHTGEGVTVRTILVAR